MIRILLPAVLVAAFICSCHQKDHKVESHSAFDSTTSKIDPAVKPAYSDTVRINYAQNRVILDVLPLIPDSVFKTWEWSKTERQGMLDMLQSKNYFIDTTKNYNTIQKITPDFFETVVVDGNFSMATYRVSNNDYIFFAKNQVGDGSNLAAYEYADGRLSELNLDYLLGVYFDYFLINRDDQTCRQQLEEVWPYLDYDLSTKNELTVTAALDKKKGGTCFSGNVLRLKFNPAYRRFDLESVAWDDVNEKASTDSVAHK
jgi:hypothetical protein